MSFLTYEQAHQTLHDKCMELIDMHVGLLGTKKPIVFSFHKAPSHRDNEQVKVAAIEIDNEIVDTTPTTIGAPICYEVSGEVTITTDTNSLPGSYPLSIKFATALLTSARGFDWNPLWMRNPSMRRISRNINGRDRYSAAVSLQYVYQSRG